jgi:hypothetical protein
MAATLGHVLPRSNVCRLTMSPGKGLLQLRVNTRIKTCYNRRSVGMKPHLGPKTRLCNCQAFVFFLPWVFVFVCVHEIYFNSFFFLLFYSTWLLHVSVVRLNDMTCEFVDMVRPLWIDKCLSFTAAVGFAVKSFSGPSLEGLLTIFYCFRPETPQTEQSDPLCIPPYDLEKERRQNTASLNSIIAVFVSATTNTWLGRLGNTFIEPLRNTGCFMWLHNHSFGP